MRRFVRVLAAAILGLALLAADGAVAQTCFMLQAELMHLQARARGGSSSDRMRYERAWREQANVIARTEMRARRAGCYGGGFFLFRRDPDPSCNVLIPKLREMQRNLDRLDQLRRRAGGGSSGGDQWRISELQDMLASRGCNVPGRGVYEAPDSQVYEPQYSSRGTYRTLCVRTCDGFYFPISFSTVPNRFQDDAATCQAMCPGTESKLFYYPNPGGGPETMTALDGQSYSSLDTAFKYRTSYDPACTCRPAGGYDASTAAASRAPQSAPDPTAPLPRRRPAPGTDPETLADRFGGFVPRAASETASGPVAAGPDGKSIRVVGPAYWGSKEQDGVMLTPIPN